MKTIIIFVTMLLCVNSIFAQSNYYTSTKTFNENGYTYQCDVPASKLVTLYNKNNKWTYVLQKYKETGKNFVMPGGGIELFQFDKDKWAREKRITIVNNAFSLAEKQRVKGEDLMISMYINPDTGKVDEVQFEFVNFRSYATIPVSVYRNIETELKKNLQFTPTEEGKKLNYILYWWGQEPK